MFRKLFFTAVALIGMTVLSGHVFAGEANEAENKSATTSTDYTGTLAVDMNGKTSSISPFVTKITENPDGTVNIFVPEFKVGKMPGTIKIDAKNVKSDGTENSYPQAVILKILGFPRTYDAKISATRSGNSISYSVTVDATYLGFPFTAIVTFTGTK